MPAEQQAQAVMLGQLAEITSDAIAADYGIEVIEEDVND